MLENATYQIFEFDFVGRVALAAPQPPRRGRVDPSGVENRPRAVDADTIRCEGRYDR